jgi:hypothetical protein
LALFADNHPERRIADRVEIGLRCFTAEPDSRPHWEKFAHAGGVCIAFRMVQGETHPAMLDADIGMGLYPVEYNQSAWELRVNRGFREVLNAFNAYADAGNRISERLVVRRSVVALAQIAALASIAAKDSKLRDEKEWRHVLYPGTHAAIEWKVTETGKRYLALPARAEGKLLLIDRVIVRSATAEEDVKTVIGILQAAGYPSDDVPMPDVTISAYPFDSKAA